MTDKEVLRPQLWKPRPVKETIAVYADWAETYDRDVQNRGYKTPERLARALLNFVEKQKTILDFGCGTGISGNALRAAGFENLHGTDVTAEMLEKASASELYSKTWLSEPGHMNFGTGTYDAIVAVGVVSLGAAPASTLADLVGSLNTGGILAFSYNEPTLEDRSYIKALDDEIRANRVELLFRENGPHLTDVEMTSDVIILRRT